MLCIFFEAHLVLVEGLLAGSVVEACIGGEARDKRRLDLLVLLLESVVKLLQPAQALEHVHVLSRSILGLIEAAEVLMLVAEVLQVRNLDLAVWLRAWQRRNDSLLRASSDSTAWRALQCIELAGRSLVVIVAESVPHGSKVVVVIRLVGCGMLADGLLMLVRSWEGGHWGELVLLAEAWALVRRLTGEVQVLFVTLVIATISSLLHLAVERQACVLISANKAIIHRMIGCTLPLEAWQWHKFPLLDEEIATILARLTNLLKLITHEFSFNVTDTL